MEFEANTVLITGGGSGIGFALAERFIQAGSNVIICGRREDKLIEAQSKYPQIHIRVCNVADPTERTALFAWATETFPALNMLVNNAGIQQQIELSAKAVLGKSWMKRWRSISKLRSTFQPSLSPIFLNRNGLQSLILRLGFPLCQRQMCLSIVRQKPRCIRLRFRCGINFPARRLPSSKLFRPLLIPISGAKGYIHSVCPLMNSRMPLWNN